MFVNILKGISYTYTLQISKLFLQSCNVCNFERFTPAGSKVPPPLVRVSLQRVCRLMWGMQRGKRGFYKSLQFLHYFRHFLAQIQSFFRVFLDVEKFQYIEISFTLINRFMTVSCLQDSIFIESSKQFISTPRCCFAFTFPPRLFIRWIPPRMVMGQL